MSFLRKILAVLLILLIPVLSHAESLFRPDTFAYTINLDLNQNAYLKSVPQDLLKGFCSGNWNAYYPKREFNQCLFDDFLSRFKFTQRELNDTATACMEDYCNSTHFRELYSMFTKKLLYREVVFYDPQHSVVKRELLSIQVFYSRKEYDGWKHYNGPVFWMKEVNKYKDAVMVYNELLRTGAWTLEKEFRYPGFLVNESKQADDRQKIEKYGKAEEY